MSPDRLRLIEEKRNGHKGDYEELGCSLPAANQRIISQRQTLKITLSWPHPCQPTPLEQGLIEQVSTTFNAHWDLAIGPDDSDWWVCALGGGLGRNLTLGQEALVRRATEESSDTYFPGTHSLGTPRDAPCTVASRRPSVKA